MCNKFQLPIQQLLAKLKNKTKQQCHKGSQTPATVSKTKNLKKTQCHKGSQTPLN